MPVIYNRIPAIAAKAVPMTQRALAKTAYDTEAAAKVLAPVDTGNLMNSIMAEQAGALTWRVYANADYAIYVEMGTRKMSARPYLEPALRQTWPTLVAKLRSLL